MANNKTTAVYCRLALRDDARMEQQKTEVLRYATEQDYDNVELYVDNGASGNNTDRPAFRKMEVDIAAGKVGMVIVRSICRIGRDIAIMDWIDELKRKGVTVKAMDGSCDDLTNPVAEFIRKINAIYEVNAI